MPCLSYEVECRLNSLESPILARETLIPLPPPLQMSTMEVEPALSPEEAPRPLLEALREPGDVKQEDEPGQEESSASSSSFSLSTRNLESLKEDDRLRVPPERQDSVSRVIQLEGPGAGECEVSQSPFKAPPSTASASVPASSATKTEVQSVLPPSAEKAVKQESSSESPRSKDRPSSQRHHHRPRRANVRIQCRLDKTLGKNVGFSSSPSSSSSSRRGRRMGQCMANPCPTLEEDPKYKHGHLMSVEVHPNGGSKVLHMWQDDLEGMSEAEMEEVAKEFLTVKKNTTVTERPGVKYFLSHP